MSVRSLCVVALTLVAVSLAAQTIQGPEPGAFLYSYDTDKQEYMRTYYNTLQDAQTALEIRRNQALANATALNQAAQSNVNPDAVADWLIFFEQWHLWQGWVQQEYGIENLGDSLFEAVPGAPQGWLGSEAGGEAQANNQRRGPAAGGYYNQRDTSDDPALGSAEGPYAGGGGFAPNNQNQPEEPTGPEPGVTIATFMGLSAADRDAAILDIRAQIEKDVQNMVQEDYSLLSALLDNIELSQDRRERREVYTQLQQREITDLCEIILNRQAAEEIQVGDTLYLFSEQPLTRAPANSVNIPTNNLTPYDIFNEDGTVRHAQ